MEVAPEIRQVNSSYRSDLFSQTIFRAVPRDRFRKKRAKGRAAQMRQPRLWESNSAQYDKERKRRNARRGYSSKPLQIQLAIASCTQQKAVAR